MTKEERKLKLALKKYCIFVQSFITAMDRTMEKKESLERGKIIGSLIESLDMQTQAVMHFDAGMTFGQIKKIRDGKNEKLNNG